MPLIKIKVCDASSQPQAGISVALSGCGELKTTAEGMVQFLAGPSEPTKLSIGGAVVWTGELGELTRGEVFVQSASGYTRSPVA